MILFFFIQYLRVCVYRFLVIILFIKEYNLYMLTLPMVIWWLVYVSWLFNHCIHRILNLVKKDHYHIAYFPEESTSWLINYLIIYPQRSAFNLVYFKFKFKFVGWNVILTFFYHLTLVMAIGVPFVWILYIKKFFIYEGIWEAWFYLSPNKNLKIIIEGGRVVKNMKTTNMKTTKLLMDNLRGEVHLSYGLLKIPQVPNQHAAILIDPKERKDYAGIIFTTREQPKQQLNKLFKDSQIGEEKDIVTWAYVQQFSQTWPFQVDYHMIKNPLLKNLIRHNLDTAIVYHALSIVENPDRMIMSNTKQLQISAPISTDVVEYAHHIVYKSIGSVQIMKDMIIDLDVIKEYYKIKEALDHLLFEIISSKDMVGGGQWELHSKQSLIDQAIIFQENNSSLFEELDYDRFDREILIIRDALKSLK